jgi:hypothetical protein
MSINESHHKHRAKFSNNKGKRVWNTSVWGSGRDKSYLTIYLPNEFAEKYGISVGSDVVIEDLEGKGLLVRNQ